MANDRLVLEINLKDVGDSFKEGNKNAKELRGTLESIKKLTSQTNNKAAAAGYSAAGQNIEYGRGRGAMGSTGAAGRDFANQAQGLGGLVRLYATYAANVFAVSAAFSALSEAMNTTMMIRGLDQLGASSGVAMGGLAKQFAAASEGAISLREAMEATAKATSSGLSKKQFMELGAVAKGASQALGVNMSDAVSRLTRGITKLEPELLDELGIFTKVGKASEEYARSVGKSVDSLTDFEKRQAFANAVLTEGRQKFGEIAAESNPYDKLLASLKNVAQEILSTVNVVVAPVAKFLADNTALIGVAIAATAVKISQQAIPALTSWRAALKSAAEDAVKRAEQINTSFGEAFVERAQQRAKVPQIQLAIKQAEEEFRAAKQQFVELDNIYKAPNDTLRALQKDRLLNERELSAIKSDVTKKTNQNTEASLKHAQSLVAVQAAQQKILDLQKQEIQANDIVQAQADKRSRLGSQEWQREQIVINERAKAAKLVLISGVGTAVEERGIGALKGFYSDVAASKDLGKLDKLKTAGIGTFVGLSTAAGIFAKSLMSAFAYIEIAIVAFGLLDLSFSKNGKQLDAFKSGIDSLAESTKTATNVTEKYGNTLSTDSINAKATAFGNLNDGIAQTVSQLRAADSAASGWDKFIDGFKTIFGGDIRSKFSTGFTESLAAAIKLAPEGEVKYELERKLSAILGTKDLGLEGLTQALNKVPTEKLVDTAKNISVALEASDKILKRAQAVTQEVKETGKAASDAFLAFSTGTFGSTALQTFLITTTKNIFAIKNALQDTIGATAEFKNIVEGTTKLEFLPPEQAAQLKSMAINYTDMQYSLKAQINNLDKIRSRITEINKEFSTFGPMSTGKSSGLVSERAALQAQLPKLQLDVVETERALKEKAKEAGEIMGAAVGKQLDLVFEQTALKLKQLNIGYQQQVLGMVPVKTQESVREQARLAIAAIDVELQLRKSNENLINSIDLLRVQMEVNAANEKLRFAQAETGPGRGALLAEATTVQEKASAKYAAMKSGNIEELKKYAAEDPGALKAIMNKQNAIALDTEAQNKKKLELLKAEVAVIELSFASAKESYEYAIKIAEEEAKDLKLKKGIVGNEAAIKKVEEDTLRKTEPLRQALALLPGAESATKTQAISRSGLSGAVSQATLAKIAGQQAQVTTTTGMAGASSIEGAAQAANLAQAKQFTADLTVQEELRAAAATNTFNIQKEGIAASREQLSYAETVGALTKQDIAAKTRVLAIEEAEIERRQKLAEVEKQRFLESLAYSDKVLEAGGEETAELKRQYDLIVAKATYGAEAAERDYQAKLKTADITASLVSRQTQYETVFKNSFEGMADALVEFTKTGKLNFKGLIDSMIEGLIRYEMQQQALAMYASFRPGLMGFLGGLFAKPTGMGASPDGIDVGNGLLVQAKGGVYDAGLRTFAKGGMFTNSIVSQPTLFKFAKGTGLMGEAGPEAIMPLKRDSNGNLGVRSGGGGSNVDVVVNNYGSERATTKETTDNRGNRRIEVVIGDMVASEVARPGSSVQQSLAGNFNNKPALARR